MNLSIQNIIVVPFLAVSAQCGVAATIFVDDDARPGGDGLIWDTAFNVLQDALAIARSDPQITEIRVAQGLYKPDAGNGITPGDRDAAFDLVSGTSLRGGYAGLNAPNPDARDFVAYVTVLTGDLLGNDGPNFTNYADNSYRVVRAVGVDPSTLIEGFTIMASQKKGLQGQGFFHGGGLFCSDGGATIRNCRFEQNWAYYGGGVGIPNGVVRISLCTFEGNRAEYNGGGMLAQNNPDVVPDVEVEDCTFIGNVCMFQAGGAISAGVAGTKVRRCTFIGNAAAGGNGGAISGSPTADDCVFMNNLGDDGGATSGGGVYHRCRFEDNTGYVTGGAAYAPNSMFAARFVGCQFIRNRTRISTGGAARGGQAFINCRFVGNETGTLVGGAAGGAVDAVVSTIIANCDFSGNDAGPAGTGGAVHVTSGISANIVNCTFSANVSGGAGPAVDGPATISNSIFWNHAGAPLSGVASVNYSCAPQALAPPGVGNIIADPRLVNPNGPDGIPGTEDDDLRIRSDSPCIDAGDTIALPPDQFDLDGDGDIAEPLPLDLFGNARVLDLPWTANTGMPGPSGIVVDMGSCEYRRPADVAPSSPPIGDGLVNVLDLLVVISHWGPCDAGDDPCVADIDGSGAVGVLDLLAVISGWG